MQYSDAGVAPATTTFRRGPRASTLADEDMDDPTSSSSTVLYWYAAAAT